MTINDRIARFVIATAKKAAEMPDAQVTFAECAAKYTSRILKNDYSGVVSFAQKVGIEIPSELTDALRRVEV